MWNKIVIFSAIGAIGAVAEPKIIADDPSFKDLMDLGAKIEKLAEGFGWSEGPVWDKKAGRLLFTDVPGNRIHSWSEKAGLETFLEPSGFSGVGKHGKRQGANGLIFGPKGQLHMCEHGDRRVSVLTEHGGKMTVADRYDGKRFNSPNDLVFHSNGSIYFTDPCFGLLGNEKSPDYQAGCNGVYRIFPDGRVELLVDDLFRPNGLCFSLDEKTLYIATSYNPASLRAYSVKEDGSLGEGREHFDFQAMAKESPGGVDGIKMDERGNIWVTGPGGVSVIDSEGKLLGRIQPGMKVANLCWGNDGYTLYLTAHKQLLRVKTKVKAGRW